MALSRVKSLGGLYLSSFDARRIKINKKVKLFYEELEKKQSFEPIAAVALPIDATTVGDFSNYAYAEAPSEKKEGDN